MKAHQLRLPTHGDLVVGLFAGGGAACIALAAAAEPEEVVDELEERAPRKLRVAR